MRCPFCRGSNTRVLDTRPTDDRAAMRRRRSCDGCGERFTTYERHESESLIVRKRGGSAEPFDVSKLRVGVEKAFSKRPATPEQIADIVTRIESEARERGGAEVESSEIGRLVMENLRRVDDVAYVRFASVHRDFQDAERFVDAVEELGATKDPVS